MKPIKTLLMVLICMVVLLAGKGYSYAAPVTGIVDPGSTWASTLSGTANYTFTNLVGGSNAPMAGLVLAFEGDVFKLNSTGIIASSVSSGWNIATLGNGAYEFSLLSGAPIQAGSSLTFSAGYSLLGSALSLSSWDTGSFWGQAFGVLYAGAPFYSSGVTVYNGGPAVGTPEPASLLLFGTAITGLAIWRRRFISTHK